MIKADRKETEIELLKEFGNWLQEQRDKYKCIWQADIDKLLEGKMPEGEVRWLILGRR